jgi:predicted N-acetyltransferase YhbS
MSDITISIIKDEQEIDILRNVTSEYKDFVYRYDEETLNLLKKNLKHESSLYIVAKQDGDFVAFCSVDTEWWEDNYFFIREIFVKPDFQKQKIGEDLIKQCIDHARQKGAVGIVTETAFENIPMQKFCAKLGFEKWDNPHWKEGITYKLLF